jgi:glycosyltransferase involved in cell wall biosynthesis/GNAT superfamily N-acetyltransferase
MERALGRPRTVLFLHGSSGGYGADRQLELLATGLDPARYRALVVLPERGELGARLEDAGVELTIAPLAVLQRRLRQGHGLVRTARLLTSNIRVLGDLARERRVSIVHSNYSLILCGQRVAARSWAAHFLHVREIYPDPCWPLLRRRLLRADAVACVSAAVATRFSNSDRVFVLHDGLVRQSSGVGRDDARRALGLQADAFVVASMGRISDWKGQDVLLRALADPLLSEIGAVGLLAGDAAPNQEHFELELAELAASLNLNGRVRLLGFRDDVDVLLAAADAVAVPSTYPDSLPNSAIEAAAAGLPVVATDTGGQREIVRDGVTGRIVQPGDPHALAGALRELAVDPRTASQLGRAGAEDVHVRFDPANMLDDLQERYDRLLAARPVGPPAWLLPVKRLAVSHPAAPDMRIARLASWLEELGYRPVVLERRGLRSAPALVLRALRERPALVLAAAAVHAPALAAIKRLLGYRTCTVADVIGLHSLEVDQASAPSRARPVVRAIWNALEGMLVRAADLVIAVNDRHAEIVRLRHRPDGVSTLRDTAEADVLGIGPLDRATIGVTEKTVLIGFAGSLVYGRLDPLFDAWEQLLPADACLVVIGDGPDLERYRSRATDAVFLGGLPRQDALAALRACDVGYSDCWSEAGFPAKVFEYLALGLPVLTEAKPQALEVLRHEHDALLYGSHDELAEQLRRLVADPELRARLGASARDTFLDRHTAGHRQGEFEAVLAGSAERLTIRPLSREDLDRLFRGSSRVFGEEWLERQNRSAAYVAVAELHGAPVGRVGLDFAKSTPTAAYLSSAYVRRRFRSHGVGTALCLHLEDVARDRGFRAIRLGVNKENHRAQQLYGRLGYDVCGEEIVRWSRRRLGRTVDVVEDCSAMQKNL